MTTELYWTGQDDVEVFHDTQRNIEYWPSERPHEAPDEAVDWYLSFDGWSESPPDAVDSFDAGAFIDDSWQSVTAAIEDGEVDVHLNAVEEAEEARDPAPRDSVMSAIEDRRAHLSA